MFFPLFENLSEFLRPCRELSIETVLEAGHEMLQNSPMERMFCLAPNNFMQRAAGCLERAGRLRRFRISCPSIRCEGEFVPPQSTL